MKREYSISALLLCLMIFMFGCATTAPMPEKTQLQLREFQTRTYETNDMKMVMKAVLNVLQDDGYIVKNANTELGLLSASKEADISSGSEKFFAQMFMGANAVYKQNSIVECSANVSEYGKVTRVRVNFQVKNMDNRGGVMKVEQVGDENYYKEFFSKVDKGIFIQKEKL